MLCNSNVELNTVAELVEVAVIVGYIIVVEVIIVVGTTISTLVEVLDSCSLVVIKVVCQIEVGVISFTLNKINYLI